MNKPIKEYSPTQNLAKFQSITGVILIALGIVLYFIFEEYTLLLISLISVMLLFNGLSNKKLPSVRIFDAYIEIRNGNSSKFISIAFKDMVCIKEAKQLKTLHYNQNDKEQKLVLMPSMVSADYREFIDFLEQNIEEQQKEDS